MRIVRLANFVHDRSGGLRTALTQLGAGYLAAGHEPVLVVPGPAYTEELTGQGLVVTLPGPVVPGTGGYRLLVDRPRVARLLRRLRPERLEVSDRFSLRWTGRWAKRRGIPSMMVSHESLAGLLSTMVGRLPTDRIADAANRRTAACYDRVVCTTSWAAAEFRRVGATNVSRISLGVDLDRFHPTRRDPKLRASLAAPDELLLLHCGRLSPEKRPERSLAALAELRRRDVPAVLVVTGDGPRRDALMARAREQRLPVRFLGFVTDADHLAELLATADIVLAPGPIETFCLAALEALASGTPVVASAQSALPEVLGDAGLAAPGEGPAYAEAVLELAARPIADRRALARRRAERYSWPAATDGFLAAHGIPVPTRVEADVP
jgi:alpha-1,6-mannosyltransferase